MSRIKFNNQEEEYAAYESLIRKRDGLLVRQMYQFIDPDDNGYKLKEGTFCLHLKKALKGKDARLSHPETKSRTQYYSFLSHSTKKRKYLMIMLAEWELVNQRDAEWFYKEKDLYKIYKFMSQHVENEWTKNKLNEAGNWHFRLAKNKQNRKSEKAL